MFFCLAWGLHGSVEPSRTWTGYPGGWGGGIFNLSPKSILHSTVICLVTITRIR